MVDEQAPAGARLDGHRDAVVGVAPGGRDIHVVTLVDVGARGQRRDELLLDPASL